jgi:hypothetical protein
MLAEHYERLHDLLGDDAPRWITIGKMEGDTNQQVCRRLGRSLRAV